MHSNLKISFADIFKILFFFFYRIIILKLYTIIKYKTLKSEKEIKYSSYPKKIYNISLSIFLYNYTSETNKKIVFENFDNCTI